MAYGFYFDGNEIPITPGSVKFSLQGNNKEYTLIDQGPILVAKLPKLQEITFDILLPTREYPFANNSDTSPSSWIETLRGYMENKQPFQFVITRTTDWGESFHGDSIRCVVDSMGTEEDHDDYGTDVNVPVTLKQYVEYGTKTVTLAKARETDNAPVTPAEIEADKADNPVAIAKVATNSGSNAKTIAKDNAFAGVTPSGSYEMDYPDTRQQKLSRLPSSSSKSTNSTYTGPSAFENPSSAVASTKPNVNIRAGLSDAPTKSSRFTITGPSSSSNKTSAETLFNKVYSGYSKS